MDGPARGWWWLLVGPALAVAVVGYSLWATFDDPPTPPSLVHVELALGLGVALLLRRRAPQMALALAAVAVVGLAFARSELDLDQLAVLVVMTAAVRRTIGWRVAAIAAVAGCALVLATLEDNGRTGGVNDFLWIPLVVLSAVVVGAILRQWDGRRSQPHRRVAPTRRTALVGTGVVALIVAVHGPVEAATFGPSSLPAVRWRSELRAGHRIDAVALASDGDVLVLSQVDGKAVLARFDQEGTRRWRHDLADVVPDADGGDLAATDDGGAVVAVARVDPIAAGLETDITTGLVVRVDAAGRTRWDALLAGPVTGVYDVAVGTDGTVAVVGQRPSPDETTPASAFVETFGSDGAAGWIDVVTGVGPSSAFAATAGADGQIIVGGSRSIDGGSDAFVRTYQPDGTMVRDDAIDVGAAEVVADLVSDADGRSVAVVLSADSFDVGGQVTSTIRAADADGAQRWTRTVEGSSTTIEAVALGRGGEVIGLGRRSRRIGPQDLSIDIGMWRWDDGGRQRSETRIGTREDEVVQAGSLVVTGDGDLVFAHDINPGAGDRSTSAVVRLRPPWK